MQGKQSGRSAFEPVFLIAVALLATVIFQSSQLIRDNQRLKSLKLGQDKSLSEARNVRKQFDSIAQGTAELAAQGNQNAAILLKELEKIGVTVNLPADPAE
jgi:hypothetical protein